MGVKIEYASIRFLDKLCDIERQCFKKEAFTKPQIACMLADYNTITLIARAYDEIAGFIIGQIEITRNTLVGHVLTVDTVPSYRRKGTAQNLLRKIETIFREAGVKECRLEVREDNIAAATLYKKLGYKKMGKLRKYYDDVHGLCLEKTL